MNDLVSKASTAYINAYGKTLMTFDERHLKGMTAAAKVLLEAALGPLTPEERGIAGADYCTRPDCLPDDYNNVLQFCLKNFIANRKARILGPKTIESRVTIRKTTPTNNYPFDVFLDDKWQLGFGTESDAEIYRKGLIAKYSTDLQAKLAEKDRIIAALTSPEICSFCGKRPQNPDCPVQMCGTNEDDVIGQEDVCSECYIEAQKGASNG